MRHVSLTCKDHPKLRWSTKEIAVSGGRYNGARHVFFGGEVDPDNIEFYSDKSGVKTEWKGPECSCPASSLQVAPEDAILAAEDAKRYPR